MMFTHFLAHAATVYGVLGALKTLLQTRQMLARRTSRGVSAGFLASYTGGYAIWLAYGLSIGSLPLLVDEEREAADAEPVGQPDRVTAGIGGQETCRDATRRATGEHLARLQKRLEGAEHAIDGRCVGEEVSEHHRRVSRGPRPGRCGCLAGAAGRVRTTRHGRVSAGRPAPARRVRASRRRSPRTPRRCR